MYSLDPEIIAIIIIIESSEINKGSHLDFAATT